MCNVEPRSRVGVRELRQNLSVYLRRVRQGETLEVTERGEPVARLTPLDSDDVWARWIAEGTIIPGHGHLRELPPPMKLPPGLKPLSEILREQRDAERF